MKRDDLDIVATNSAVARLFILDGKVLHQLLRGRLARSVASPKRAPGLRCRGRNVEDSITAAAWERHSRRQISANKAESSTNLSLRLPTATNLTLYVSEYFRRRWAGLTY